MHTSSEFGLFTRKTKTIILILSLILFSYITSITIIQTAPVNKHPLQIIIRVDDIQDFAFKEAQLFLLQDIASNNQPLSLAIITGMFGKDPEILAATRSAIASGCEVGIHGWKHENLSGLSLTTQMNVLSQAKLQTKDLLDVDPQLLIPPMFSYDNNTIAAMQHESFNIISTCTDYDEPTPISGITNMPATVELSTLSNSTWSMKSIDIVNSEVEKSFELYGYAAIVTHPQEFLSNGEMNQTAKYTFKNLLTELSKTYQFTTFGDLYLQKMLD